MPSPESSILLFHKPKGVVVTRSDELGRKSVYDVLPEWVLADGWLPVGRLDLDSRGLLLFVKDPRLIERIAQPGRFPKIYDVWIRGRLTPDQMNSALGGIETPAGVLKAAEIKILGTAGPKMHLLVTLNEGKNRHIRRLFGALKDQVHDTPLKVLELKRISFGPINLDVPSGHWRFLTEAECNHLLSDR